MTTQEAVDRLNAQIAREEAEPDFARDYEDVPRQIEAITREWLTAILCRNVVGAEVAGFQLGDGSAGTSVRRQLIVQYNAKGRAAGLPERLFTKSTPTFHTRYINGITGTMVDEATFFNKLRPELGLEAPVSVHAAYDIERFRAIFVFEDLTVGRETEFCTAQTDVTLDRAQQMTRLMAEYHGHFWEDPRFDTTFGDLRPMSRWWRHIHKMLDRDTTHEAGMDGAIAVIPSGIMQRRQDIWRVYWEAVDEHDKAPRTLIHNDPHIGNWYISDGRMGLCDWQCACVGSWARDLSYSITCSLPVENRRAWEAELLELYVAELNRNVGRQVLSMEEAWPLYRQQMVLALYFWTDVLCHSQNLPDMQPRELTLELIKRITIAMDDLRVLDR
ncbi:phosphotransferase [Sphingobium sp.]|uniref:phosphotransferase family protein n=1 Tax=Sphingobium sp. TaxID=1912891 RepID=UPI0028BDA0D6|nr:phosphotransferase [Sphingobium sp.]